MFGVVKIIVLKDDKNLTQSNIEHLILRHLKNLLKQVWCVHWWLLSLREQAASIQCLAWHEKFRVVTCLRPFAT